MRSVTLRVVALALLLLLVVVAGIALRTLRRLPDTIVYLVRDTGRTMTLEPVQRQGDRGDDAARARAALDALAAGPTAAEAARGLASEVPHDLEVRSVRVRDGLLEVDLGASFVAGGGSASMLGRLYQVAYTLTQPTSIDRVALFLEGEPLTVLGGEGVMVAHPWVRPAGGVPSW
jgi:spore germination protein GerM